MYERIDQIEAWLTPMALGIPPIDYRTMRDAFPELHETIAAAGDVEGRLISLRWREPEPAEVRRALDVLAEVVVRLWTSGYAYAGSNTEAIEAGHVPYRWRWPADIRRQRTSAE